MSRAADEGANHVELALLGTGEGNGEHHDESEADPGAHLGEATDRVVLEAEAEVEASVDAFDRGAAIVGPLPGG